MNEEICIKCNTKTLCPICHYDAFNRPLFVKYLDVEMPIIISTCWVCGIELFKSMKHESHTLHKSHCLVCISILEESTWKYKELCK